MTKFDKSYQPLFAQTHGKSHAEPTAWHTETFQELLERFHQPLYRYFAIHAVALEHAFNMTVETFVIVFRKTAPSHQAELPSWIFEIAWDVLNVHYSRLEAADVSAPTRSSGSDGAQFSRMREAFRTLAFYPRETLYLRFFAGLDTKEIALMMDKKEAAINILAYQGVNKLSAYLDNQQFISIPRKKLARLAQDYQEYLSAVLQGLPPHHNPTPQIADTTRQLMDLRRAVSMEPETAAKMMSQIGQILRAGTTTRI